MPGKFAVVNPCIEYTSIYLILINSYAASIISSRRFRYRAASWSIDRRVVAKIEWYAGELFPRVGFIVMNLRWKHSNGRFTTSVEPQSSGLRKVNMH